ncbi:MAG: hypothetical protein LKK19_01710 [Bacteroidales bacterium]|jgi:hypothetical protein|nr:hypothetical protein [Bacteroidales bacterium]MCI2121403.1 hypothetical protein [Bacteroidales bacterium]MCI2146231.1 hypothetical protein [Bacteroidales bacterium]
MKHYFLNPVLVLLVLAGTMAATSCEKISINKNVEKKVKWVVTNKLADTLSMTFYFNKDSLNALTPTSYQSEPKSSQTISAGKSVECAEILFVKGVNDSKSSELQNYLWAITDSLKITDKKTGKETTLQKKEKPDFYKTSNWTYTKDTVSNVPIGQYEYTIKNAIN